MWRCLMLVPTHWMALNSVLLAEQTTMLHLCLVQKVCSLPHRGRVERTWSPRLSKSCPRIREAALPQMLLMSPSQPRMAMVHKSNARSSSSPRCRMAWAHQHPRQIRLLLLAECHLHLRNLLQRARRAPTTGTSRRASNWKMLAWKLNAVPSCSSVSAMKATGASMLTQLARNWHGATLALSRARVEIDVHCASAARLPMVMGNDSARLTSELEVEVANTLFLPLQEGPHPHCRTQRHLGLRSPLPVWSNGC
mmetsp:Transcript_97204/g.182782  ORF Transcript_97204/g.182782 Transcript_97204/m.182782 type:complete len:252 (-) Transcript_97204:1245-2000(-)